jgi:hypothetical protein
MVQSKEKPSREDGRNIRSSAENHVPRINELIRELPLVFDTDSLSSSSDYLIDSLKDDQARLRQRMGELESMADKVRKESDLLKMKATISLGQTHLQIESLEEDKCCLMEKCQELEQKVLDMQINQVSKQTKINALRTQVLLQTRFSEEPGLEEVYVNESVTLGTVAASFRRWHECEFHSYNSCDVDVGFLNSTADNSSQPSRENPKDRYGIGTLRSGKGERP